MGLELVKVEDCKTLLTIFRCQVKHVGKRSSVRWGVESMAKKINVNSLTIFVDDADYDYVSSLPLRLLENNKRVWVGGEHETTLGRVLLNIVDSEVEVPNCGRQWLEWRNSLMVHWSECTRYSRFQSMK